MEQKKQTPSLIFEEWKRDENYKTKMKFTQDWNEYVRFKEGKQWPPVTKNTKNIPRITVNKCDFIIKNKKSNILSRGIKILFNVKEVPENMDEAMEQELDSKAQDFTDLSDNTWNDLQQTQLNRDVVDDALTIGNGFFHYYIDTSYTGGQYVQTKGRLCGHSINAMDIALGNPHLKPHEIQKQPYIIIKTVEDTDALKEQAKKTGENWQLIAPDSENDKTAQYDSEKQDVQNSNKTICLTKYFKKNGNVYWVKVTGTATIQKERPLAPTDSQRIVKLYPVEHLVFEPRVKCVYGRSAIEDSINIQKAINFLYSMISYGVQQTAWPKILSKANALAQGITNVPGEIIYDRDPTPGYDAIKYMQPPNFSSMPPQLIDKLSEDLRVITGVTEVATGEMMGANMAASAIIALQNQAQKPVDAYIDILFDSMKRVGKIWEEFYKVFYILPRSVVSTDEQGKKVSKTITPSEYSDMEFDLDIDVGIGGKFDEAAQQNFNEMLYNKGDINKYQLVKYSPKVIVNSQMRRDFEEEEQKIKEQQEMQAQAGEHADEIMGQLTPEEQQKLRDNPNIMNEVMGGMGNAV